MPRQQHGEPSIDVLGSYSDPGVLILTSLVSGPKHGYALIKDVEAFANTTIAFGTLYGALDRLTERGLIERLPADERRHPYAITDLGAEALRSYFRSLAQVTTELSLRLSGAGG